jgi:hypothetical protein
MYIALLFGKGMAAEELGGKWGLMPHLSQQ